MLKLHTDLQTTEIIRIFEYKRLFKKKPVNS